MTDGLFLNFSGITHQIQLSLYDEAPNGACVWQANTGDEVRFVEGHVDDEIWVILNRVVHAYDE